MRFTPRVVSIALLCIRAANATSPVQAVDKQNQVTYHGLRRNDVEVFLGIPYGQNTGGENRFKPPKLSVPARGSTVTATAYGPACPQPLGQLGLPIALGNITEISEDCLNLNVARPKATRAGDRLPVMVYIHGGGFWFGSNAEPTTSPDGLVLESVRSGLPVIHVAMNYRLGGEPSILPFAVVRPV